MSEWPELSISELATIEIGGTPSRAIPAFWAEKPSGYPWISIADLKGKYVSNTKEHITSLGVRSSNVKLIPDRTTVMSFKLTVGRTAITATEMYCNEAIAIFQPKDGRLDASWLYHALPRAAGSVVTDTAVKGVTLNKAKMAAMSLRLPPPAEQASIAHVLDTLDAAIHKTEALIAKLKAVKQGLLHDLLTRGIDANGELRPPQPEAPQLYTQSPLGWLPKDWNAGPLSHRTAAEITYGIVQAGPHVPGGVPYVRTGDMSGDALIRESMLCTSRRIASSYARSEVRTGEIVMAIRASVGKVLPVPPDLDGANLTQGTARISPNSKTDGTFLLWAVRHSRTQKAIQLETKGTTFAEITLGALRRVLVAAPVDLEEQTEIGKRLTVVDELLSLERESLAKCLSQKAGLMDDLLTGRVRVTPLLATEPEGSA
jgi:type I restriction enzyme S subunit